MSIGHDRGNGHALPNLELCGIAQVDVSHNLIHNAVGQRREGFADREVERLQRAERRQDAAWH